MLVTMLHLVHRMKTHTWTGNSRGFDLATVAGVASCVHGPKEATANFAPTGSSGLPRSGGGGTRPGLHQACPPLPPLPRQPLLPAPKHPLPQRPHQGPHAGPPPHPRRRAAGARSDALHPLRRLRGGGGISGRRLMLRRRTCRRLLLGHWLNTACPQAQPERQANDPDHLQPSVRDQPPGNSGSCTEAGAAVWRPGALEQHLVRSEAPWPHAGCPPEGAESSKGAESSRGGRIIKTCWPVFARVRKSPAEESNAHVT